jgi:hypothetical protein
VSALIDHELAAAKLNGIAEMFRDLNTADLAATVEHAALLLGPPAARPRSEWSDGDPDVLWWHFPVQEAPYCGSPLDDDWPEEGNGRGPQSVPFGYYTHWTPIVVPKQPPGIIAHVHCSKDPTCCLGEGHKGDCDEIPF